MKIKAIQKHLLNDFIPENIMDKNDAHYLYFFSITRTTDGEYSSHKNYSNKNAAIHDLQAKHEKLKSSVHVTNLSVIHVSGEATTSMHYHFTYEFKGIDKELAVSTEYMKMGA